MHIKHLIRKTYEVISPYAGVESVQASLLKNSFLLVVEQGKYVGLLTPSDIVEHPYRLVIDCLGEKPRVDSQCNVELALELMKESQNSVLPVFDGEELIGVVTQDDIIDFLSEYRKDLEHEVAQRQKTEQALRKSEARFRMMAETSLDYIFQIDKDGTAVYCSPALERILGYTPEERQGQHFSSLVLPSDLPKVNALFQQVIKGKTLQNVELNLVHKSGRKVPVEANVTPVFENDEVISIFGVARDITERKKVDEALRESEQKWRCLVENAPDLILTVKPDGTILFLNRAVPPFTPEKAIGTSVYEYVSPDHHQTLRNALEQVVRTGEPCSYELAGYGPDGRTLWHQNRLGPIKKDGQVVAMVLIATDVTEQKQAEIELRQSENKYRTLLENLPQKIFLKDISSVYLSCNENYARDLKIKAEEIIGKTDYDFYPKDLAEKYRADDKKVMESGQTEDIEERYIQDGKESIVHTVKTPVRDDQGNVIGILGIFWDITERKKAEERIKEIAKQWNITFDSIADLISIQSKDFKIVKVNKAFADLFKLKPDELIGKFCYEVIHGTKEPYLMCPHKRALESGRPAVEEFFEPNLQIYLNISASPIFNDSGEIEGTVHIVEDITKRKKAEEQLSKSEEKYRALVENADDFIYTVDKSGCVRSLNKAAARLFGKKPGEIIGKSLFDLFPKEIANHNIHGIKTVFETGETFRSETSLRVGEKELWVSANLNPLKDSEGKIYAVMGISRDITEQKKAEEELREYREKMARAERLASVGTLSATMAHELIQPLMVINLSIENALAELESTSCPQAVKEELKNGLSGVSRAASIVNGFRNYARKSSQKITKEVDLKAVAEGVVRLLNDGAQRARVELSLKGMEKLPTVYLVEQDIEQLFFALAENAIQAADGKKIRQFVISGAVRGRHIELKFSDNCGGIAPENLDRIFEPFFTTKPAGERTGMGLCIVQSIISRAGGKIRVESKPGTGSTFFVTLPLHEHKT